MQKQKPKNDFAPRYRFGWRTRIVLGIAIILITGISFWVTRPSDPFAHLRATSAEDRDRLAYITNDNQLRIYDPYDHTDTLLAENVHHFIIAPTGQIAYTLKGVDDNIYVMDSYAPSEQPIMIPNENSLYMDYWSPDGQYLIFHPPLNEENHVLFLWDGDEIRNILSPEMTFPLHIRSFFAWNYDGILFLSFGSGDDTQLFTWDGEVFMPLDLAIEGFIVHVEWSENGQLLIVTSTATDTALDTNTIYVWDGDDNLVSVASGWYPFAVRWVDEGTRIAFKMEVNTPYYSHQYVIWDVTTDTIVRRIPLTDDFNVAGRGGPSSAYLLSEDLIVSTALAGGVSVYVDIYDSNGEHTFFTVAGSFTWSDDGFLAYCQNIADVGWNLALWDGTETIYVATSHNRTISWQNGGFLNCSSG